jgi:outer membrane PBP1 activator LpoA protein
MSPSLSRVAAGHEFQPRPTPALIVLTLIALTWIIAGCQSMEQSTSNVTTSEQVTQAKSLAAQNRHTEAASVYLNLAQQHTGTARQRYRILAAGEQRLAGEPATARATLDQISAPVDAKNLVLWAQVSGSTALDLNQPRQALADVEQAPANTDGQPAANLLAIKAEALFRLDQPIDATNTLIEREIWLNSPAAIAGNQQRLWQSYKDWGGSLTPESAQSVDDPILAGWLELGVIASASDQDPRAFRVSLSRWQTTNTAHPANDILVPSLISDLRRLQAYPERIALVLPLSGRQHGAATAIRDGFFAAHFEAINQAQPLTVRVYDSAASGPAEAYTRAVADGADFIVGPLLKNAVLEIAAGPVPVTTLALNFLPDETSAPPGFYQFSLSPDDEARQAARRAVMQNQIRAIALAPNNAWGRRLMDSFTSELQSHGGKILDYRYYDPVLPDYSRGIENLMLISESQARAERLQANLNVQLDFEPRRRADIDLIFMAANAQSGKLIRPQLRFYFAGQIPTYATSAIYQQGSRGNKDLNGIMFPDIPWILQPDDETRRIRNILAKYWPTQAERRTRLHALGYDAYQLMPVLFGPSTSENLALSGATGQLYLDANGQFHRELPWARIERGKAKLMEPLPENFESDIAQADINRAAP